MSVKDYTSTPISKYRPYWGIRVWHGVIFTSPCVWSWACSVHRRVSCPFMSLAPFFFHRPCGPCYLEGVLLFFINTMVLTIIAIVTIPVKPCGEGVLTPPLMHVRVTGVVIAARLILRFVYYAPFIVQKIVCWVVEFSRWARSIPILFFFATSPRAVACVGPRLSPM